MDWKEVAATPCPVASALDLLGDRWSMLVIRDVMNGVRRFDDLIDRLAISRATLSDRLRRLTEAGILKMSDYTDGRGRVRSEYRLTQRGWDLQFVLVALREWGDKNALGEGNEPLRLIHRESGQDVRLALVDTATGEVVESREVELVPGPAFKTRGSGRNSDPSGRDGPRQEQRK
ncbi:MAG: helix-turn-helix transcriptional regulator [Dehalococcoidia bacterium]|jgi:DNA-binding HxlR family transcriptional regulator|uniref:winged helix-turn-helix transcriptional regulator n=1 Tax=Candidatus Amarobacter glycogenicus TaxID=3140699 RepID=UPI001DE35269|nr:helix-turn-helix transcriptional regulator [Dehalococcoidia bacterium]MBK6562104.1 helix-turn-helix transcriptional regulator [Dehalococcoidia bacterium]MBK7726550.1 helix-turn-helix transcriptional regulator [Dehalococcoidia bacterium]MBK8561172.1 helix-turn-helix transcriptional regulator [Dehalococcoidia bacterium]MBK9344184.1 helix-turn-helix transcriptional regulator [Dehalococcoidia bacterium]